ncbi:MAG: outer membrane lipoprotein carrier protein LolA [Desulfobacteraceae bacterium]
MRKTAAVLIASFAVLCLSPAAWAASSVLGQIEKKMESIHTLSADFIQTKHLAMFETPVEITGTIHMEKPEKLAWKAKEPVKYTLVIDRDGIIRQDGQTGKTSRISIKDNPAMNTAVQQIKMWFSGEYAALDQGYDIAVESENPASIVFEPKPDNPAESMLDRVSVRFRKDGRYISRIRITEKGGDLTEIVFKNIKVNQKIPDSTWNPGK